ncbi:MAG TPA: transposase, partial [Candidatus Sumerlaeota bacterium]|nr:transposase [Candidatus Sumerlaeota bacterium]
MPHFDQGEAIQHVTFRLADSLPRKVLDFLEEGIRVLPPEKQDAERRKRMEAGIDAGHGSCVLREPSVAEMVQNALFFFDGQRYRLLAWAVMPNHVHVLFQPMVGWTVPKIVASWKKYTAARICAFRRSALPQTGVAVPGGVVPGTANLLIGAVK